MNIDKKSAAKKLTAIETSMRYALYGSIIVLMPFVSMITIPATVGIAFILDPPTVEEYAEQLEESKITEENKETLRTTFEWIFLLIQFLVILQLGLLLSMALIGVVIDELEKKDKKE